MPRGAKGIRPVKIVVVLGAPIPAPAGERGGRPSRRAVRETTRQLRSVVQELFDEAQLLAGRSNA